MPGRPVRLQMAWPELNSGYVYNDTYLMDRKQQQQTLLCFYCTKHASTGTTEQWTARIASGQIRVNGNTITTCSHLLSHGDQLAYERLPWQESSSPNYVDVLYEDEHVVAVHKPNGLQVLPAAMQLQRTVLTLLHQLYRPRCSPPGQPETDTAAGAAQQVTAPVPVHRLGRGTSGLLLCAASEEARRKLADVMTHTTVSDTRAAAPGAPSQHAEQQHMENNTQHPWPAPHTHGCVVLDAACIPELPACAVRKMYRTRVQGLVTADQGQVCVPIGRIPYPGVRGGLHAACTPGDPAGKASRTMWTVVHRDLTTQETLLNVEIFTGRPHQIRIHMAAMGHPLVGDPLYLPGGRPAIPGTTQHSVPPPCQTSAISAGTCDHTHHIAQPSLAPPSSAHPADDHSLAVQEPTAAADEAATRPVLQCGDGRPEVVVPGDGGYLLHSWQLMLRHPARQDKVLHLLAPLPPELAAPWELE